MLKRTLLLALCLATVSTATSADSLPAGLDPRGTLHIPIGIPDTVDTLKTFVEAEGNFSPGCGSYGLYFWVFDHATGKLIAPTMKDVSCRHGLTPEGYLIPWSAWPAGELAVKTSVCEVQRSSPAGQVFVVGAKVILSNPSAAERRVSLYVALRPLGPAGYAVKQLDAGPARDALLWPSGVGLPRNAGCHRSGGNRYGGRCGKERKTACRALGEIGRRRLFWGGSLRFGDCGRTNQGVGVCVSGAAGPPRGAASVGWDQQVGAG
jgi:hypothetical protein